MSKAPYGVQPSTPTASRRVHLIGRHQSVCERLIISNSRFQRQGQGPPQDNTRFFNSPPSPPPIKKTFLVRREKKPKKWHSSQHRQPRRRPELNSSANEVNSFRKSQKFVPPPSISFPPTFLYRLPYSPHPFLHQPTLEKNTSHTQALTPLTPPKSFEHVLASINKLNRNLEAVITVGNEFSSVEALWSTFENVMGKPAAPTAPSEEKDQSGEGQIQQLKTEVKQSRTSGNSEEEL